MTMLNKNISLKWVQKYSHTSVINLTPGTINWYKYCQKIGRRKYLKKSRIKTKRFERNNPGNLQFRVFKCLVLKNKNVKPELEIKFRNLITKNRTTKGALKYKHLTPQELFNVMKGNKR